MIPERYTIQNFLKAMRRPSLLANEFDRYYHISKNFPQRLSFQLEYGSGENVLERDWDYLIILDACRFDVFDEHVDLDGDLDSVISIGSHSEEFFRKGLNGNSFYDTIYVTANGYGAQIGEGKFFDIVFTDYEDAMADMDIAHPSMEDLAPGTVYNAAVDTYDRYPQKRMIIHFMQPHAPYLGPKAKMLRERAKDEGLVVRSNNPEKFENYDDSLSHVVNNLLGAMREGYISESELQEVYRENLELAIEYVEKLIAMLPGKIVITADHGESFGEGGTLGHQRYKYTTELRKVPYLVVESEHRPTITEDHPTGSSRIDQNKLEDRLRDLGYR